MRFRVAHLLVLTAIVCAIALSFATLMPLTAVAYVKLGGFVVYTLMAIRAIARPGLERVAIGSALVAGLPYFCWTLTLDEFQSAQFPTSELIYAAFHGYAAWTATPEDPMSDYGFYRWIVVQVGHVAFSFLLAGMGGLLGAYWHRCSAESGRA